MTRELTEPQRELLEDICEHRQAISTAYTPARKLVEMGYAVWVPSAFSDLLCATEAGRAAISKAEGRTP